MAVRFNGELYKTDGSYDDELYSNRYIPIWRLELVSRLYRTVLDARACGASTCLACVHLS